MGRTGPWTAEDVDVIKAWAAQELRAERKPGDGAEAAEDGSRLSRVGREAKVELDLEKIRTNRLKRQILEGQYVPVEETVRAWAARANLIRNRLLRLPTELAPALVGMSRREIESIITAHVTRICQEFADGGPVRVEEREDPPPIERPKKKTARRPAKAPARKATTKKTGRSKKKTPRK